jgi:hypothetical protein
MIGQGHWTGGTYFLLYIGTTLGWLLLAYALGRSRLVPSWQARVFGISTPVMLLLTDGWLAIGGLLILVAVLPLAPLVARGRPAGSGPGTKQADPLAGLGAGTVPRVPGCRKGRTRLRTSAQPQTKR